MKRTKFLCYHSYQGDFLEYLRKKLPYVVYKKVYSLYLIHSVPDMLVFEDFEFFRARFDGVRVTFQQYVDCTWCCRIEY